MNKITPEASITRRQLLLTFAAGAAGLASSAAFAKLPSVGSTGNKTDLIQHEISISHSNDHFVMYF